MTFTADLFVPNRGEEKFGPDPETRRIVPDDFSFHETNEVTRPRSPENGFVPAIVPSSTAAVRGRLPLATNAFHLRGRNKQTAATNRVINLRIIKRANVFPKFPSYFSFSPPSLCLDLDTDKTTWPRREKYCNTPYNCFLIEERDCNLLILLIMRKKLRAM